MKKWKWEYTRIVFYALLIGIFYIIPVKTVESGSLCVLYQATGLLCPGCGVTRGFANFLHLQFSAAFRYNPVFTCSLFPVGVFLAVQDTAVILWRRLRRRPMRSMVEFAWDLLMGR